MIDPSLSASSGDPEAEGPSTRLDRRVHRNMVEAFVSLPAHRPNGVVRRQAGVATAITHSPLPLFNVLLPEADRVEQDVVAAAGEDVRAAVQEAGVPWSVQLREGVDDHLVEVVRDLGLEEVPDASWPAMVAIPPPTAPPTPASTVARVPTELEIERVSDAASFDDHLGASGGDPTLTASWLGEGISSDARWSLYVGYVGGAPVARAMAFLHEDVVGIYNVGTRKEVRRRGYGSALTTAALAAAARAGCTTATLQSSAMALGLYTAMGFRRVYGYRCFWSRR